MLWEVYVLVEGYDDRAFWSGYLQQVVGLLRGDVAQRSPDCPSSTKRLLQRPARGQFTYLAPAKQVLTRVVPCASQGGSGPQATALRQRIERRATDVEPRLSAIIDCRDDDGLEGEPPRRTVHSLLADVEKLDASAQQVGDMVALSDGTLVVPITWRVQAASTDLPRQQTLERLVCAAVQRVYPDRLGCIATWLASRPSPPSPDKHHKAAAGGLWSGWYNNHGWGNFYEAVWQDAALAAALLELMPALAQPSLQVRFRAPPA